MANEIDELMSLDPLEMAKGDNLDKIIAYHRKNRANAEAGIKPVKEKGPKVSIAEVTANLTGKITPTAPVVSKPGSGLRRV